MKLFLLFAGVALIVAGAFLIAVPVGLIVAGVACLTAAGAEIYLEEHE